MPPSTVPAMCCVTGEQLTSICSKGKSESARWKISNLQLFYTRSQNNNAGKVDTAKCVCLPKFTVYGKCRKTQYRDSQTIWKEDGSYPRHLCLALRSTTPTSSCTSLFNPHKKIPRTKTSPLDSVLPHETTSNSILHCKNVKHLAKEVWLYPWCGQGSSKTQVSLL